MKKCTFCGESKPIADYKARRGSGTVGACIECRDRYRGWDNLTPAERSARIKPKPRHGTGYLVRLIIKSMNKKTGPIPVSMTDQKSCPDVCPFLGKGCYAAYGKTAMHWRRVGAGLGVTWAKFLDQVKQLARGTLWRHNEAGDLPGLGNTLDTAALAGLVAANVGKKGFTFTHKPLKKKREREAVKLANDTGFTINLSANSLEHADRLYALGIGPVAVVLPGDWPQSHGFTPAGHRVIECLNATHGLTCDACRLCAVPTRKSIVGFRAHGQAHGLVTSLVRSKR